MKPYTKAKLEPLIEKYQRTLTLEDVEQIVLLDNIATRIDKGVTALESSEYFFIDGHRFRHPSFLVCDFIDRLSDRYLTGWAQTLAMLWAMDADRTYKDLEKFPSTPKLLKYARKIKFSLKTAAQQIEAIFDSPDESPKQAVTPWYICSILSKELGGSPDEWFRASPTKLEEGIKVVEEIRAAEEKAAGGKKQPPKPTPLLYAIRDFNEELLKLEQSWQVD